ncbi:MAG: response regulator transcription factor, partial [Burkholderiaceae bacterium]
LTKRELDIVRTVVAESGASNKVIARKLFMSEHTLRNHLTAIYHKLGVDNRLKLFVFAMENGLGERDKS